MQIFNRSHGAVISQTRPPALPVLNPRPRSRRYVRVHRASIREAVPLGAATDGKFNQTHYTVNNWLCGYYGATSANLKKFRKLKAVFAPSAAVLVFDTNDVSSVAASSFTQLSWRHSAGGDSRKPGTAAELSGTRPGLGKCNMLHVDGHALGRYYRDFSTDFSQVRNFTGSIGTSWSNRPFFRGFEI